MGAKAAGGREEDEADRSVTREGQGARPQSRTQVPNLVDNMRAATEQRSRSNPAAKRKTSGGKRKTTGQAQDHGARKTSAKKSAAKRR